MKVDFINEDHFIIYYLTNEKYRTEEEIKFFLKLLDSDLKRIYNYKFHGFYDVNIFCSDGIYVLEFKNIDDLIANVSKIGYLPEGAIACKYVYEIGKKKDLKLPLTYVLYRILNKECSVQQALEEVMSL